MLVETVHAVAELDQGILEASRKELEEMHKRQSAEALKERVEKLRAEIDERRKVQADVNARLAAADRATKERIPAVKPKIGYKVTFVNANKKGKRKK